MTAVELPPLVCGSCQTCCKGDLITLLPGDVPRDFKTEIVNGQRVLQKKFNGECVYLTETGCSIYERQPQMCRAFDCRKYALMIADMPPLEQVKRRAALRTNNALQEGERRLAELS